MRLFALISERRSKMLIRIKYNAERFPRTIILRNHKTKVFQPNKREIDFEEYDAYLLLKNNSRLKVEKWEFNVVGVIEGTETKTIEENPDFKDEQEIQEKPHRGRPKKGGK
jgi:hypothetical protein